MECREMTVEEFYQRLYLYRQVIDELSKALRPFANMSECIENNKDFKTEENHWLLAKQTMDKYHNLISGESV